MPSSPTTSSYAQPRSTAVAPGVSMTKRRGGAEARASIRPRASSRRLRRSGGEQRRGGGRADEPREIDLELDGAAEGCGEPHRDLRVHDLVDDEVSGGRDEIDRSAGREHDDRSRRARRPASDALRRAQVGEELARRIQATLIGDIANERITVFVAQRAELLRIAPHLARPASHSSPRRSTSAFGTAESGGVWAAMPRRARRRAGEQSIRCACEPS